MEKRERERKAEMEREIDGEHRTMRDGEQEERDQKY